MLYLRKLSTQAKKLKIKFVQVEKVTPPTITSRHHFSNGPSLIIYAAYFINSVVSIIFAKTPTNI
jgi:hypothetical protein